jgi:ribosomal protein S8
MVLASALADALRNIVNAERRGKRQVILRPSSKVVIKFLETMMKHGKYCSELLLIGMPTPTYFRAGLIILLVIFLGVVLRISMKKNFPPF